MSVVVVGRAYPWVSRPLRLGSSPALRSRLLAIPAQVGYAERRAAFSPTVRNRHKRLAKEQRRRAEAEAVRKSLQERPPG